MKTQITTIIIAILLFIQMDGYSQCPTSISINSQQDVDNFSVDYPDCVSQGWLTTITISGSDITDLSGLEDIINVKSYLRWEMGSVKSFSTWSTLDSISILKVYATDTTLTSFAGLEDVTNLIELDSYSRKINDLSALTNCNLTRFYFSSDSIETISGFNAITEMENLRIDGCPNLASITGFQNLSQITQHLRLRGNSSISDISGFQSLLQVAGQIHIDQGEINDLSDFPSLQLVGGTLILEDLANLTDISLLNQFYYIESIRILDNPELEACCIIKKLLRDGIIRTINAVTNNKTNCASLFEIFDFCQDVDGDGIEDFNDNCVNSPNQNQSDFDNDGIGDGCDNCPIVSNSNQNDADGNGIGDACDTGSNNTVKIQMSDFYIDSNVNGIILQSINGNCYRLIMNDEGELETYICPCP